MGAQGQRLAVLQKLANAEKIGNADQVKRLKARLKDFDSVPEEAEEPAALSMDNTKAELLAAANEAGLEVDDAMTKAEIMEVLDGAQ
jgi:hypothetical protein